jgi:hypothetical protein
MTVHPDKSSSTLGVTPPTWSDLNRLIYSYYSHSFDYGADCGDVRRVHIAEGRLRYAFHVLMGTQPTDAELGVINLAREVDGRPLIEIT